MRNENKTTIRKAKAIDLCRIINFVDYWLSGRGVKAKAKGAVNDCFMSPSQHERYLTKYETWLMEANGEIIGWAVKHPNGSLLHLLIAGNYRSQGYGTKLLQAIRPQTIRAKTNQSTGDPTPFYVRHGYRVTEQKPSQPNLSAKSKAKDRPRVINILTSG
ncbi:MAG: GNAT family N-acetyltransferase [Candidatus Neomarinimicrobiota bacterium]|jgi:N-acetylglutamate synthase-like GNAT family acetyltransferase